MRCRQVQAGMLLAAAAIVLFPACSASSYPQMLCDDESRQNILHLVAQAVPSATLIPCIDRLHTGWTYGGSEVRSGFVRFWLDSDRVGDHRCRRLDDPRLQRGRRHAAARVRRRPRVATL